MPYSNNPVYVNPGDNVQVRYPTPSTWNTQVTVNLRIGTGVDPDGITFGTKVPDADPTVGTFNDQVHYNAFTGNNSGSGSNSIFTPNHLSSTEQVVYSNVVTVTAIEVPISASIKAVSNGPKTTTNQLNTTAAFRYYRNGVLSSWLTSIEADLANGTGGIQPGDKIQLKVTTEDWYVTNTTVTFSLNEETVGGGLPQEYVDAGVANSAITQLTWNFTTRAQDQFIPQNELNYEDKVDTVPYLNGNTTNGISPGPQYYYKRVDITSIDTDAVLRVSTTGQARVVKVEGGGNAAAPTTGYSTSLDGVVLGDDVFVRIPNGNGWTEKETGYTRFYAVGGDEYTRGSVFYENAEAGTTGSGDYEVTQTLGDIDDDWQVWTQVDRYPDDIEAAPIFTYGVATEIYDDGSGKRVGGGFNTTDIFETTTNGSGSGMRVKLIPGGFSNTAFSDNSDNSYNTVFIHDPGYGYSAGDIVTIISPDQSQTTNNAMIEIIDYEKVIVSQSTEATVEPGFMYFVELPVSGLGTEYVDGSYDDLETPYSNYALDGTINALQTTQNRNAALDGQDVVMKAVIDGTAGQIRKNNTGTWSTSEVNVSNGDTIIVKLTATNTFGGSVFSTVRLVGPPNGDPIEGNPTGGPTSPARSDRETTYTLTTRSRRVIPYPFHADPIFLSNPGQEHISEVKIEGLDVYTNATITGGVGLLSTDDSNYQNTVVIQPTDKILYVKTNASSTSGAVTTLTYKIYRDGQEAFDTLRIYTRYFNNIGNYGFLQLSGEGQTEWEELELPYYAVEDFFLTLVGAGGGRGGDDAPNSQGAGGGSGNLLRLRVQKPASQWPLQVGAGDTPDGRIRGYAADAGEDGQSFIQGGGGGAGGFGYAAGGDGGNAGNGDKSGAGGGGGGATAITMWDGTLIAMAGGGGGGSGAGNDTEVPAANAFGNHGDSHGSLLTTTTNINTAGDDAPDATGQGAGPGGGGGGYDGTAGTLLTQKLDADGNVIQTTDLDATGGTGGGGYYNPTGNQISVIFGGTPDGRGAGPGNFGAIYIEYPPQDTVPEDFDFDQLDGQDIQTVVTSNKALITGITGKVPITITAAGFSAEARVCSSEDDADCGNWGASQIGNNQYIQLRATTGVSYNTPYTVTVQVGGTSSNWVINTGPPPDRVPNFYNFTNVDDQALSTLTTSETAVISGINVPVQVFANNSAEIRILNEDNTVDHDWAAGNLTTNYIENNQKLQVRVTSSADYADDVDVLVTVGEGNTSQTTWTVRTLDEVDTLPDFFNWLDVSEANPNQIYTSNVNKIDGLGGSTYFQVDFADDDQSDSSTPALPEILIGGIAQVDSNGDPLTYVQINNLDQLSLRYETSDVLGEPRSFITRTGGIYNTTTEEVEGTDDYPVYLTDWKVTTAGSFTSNPAEFTFQTILATGPSVATNSAESPSISGLGQVTPVITSNGLKVSINGQTFVSSPLGAYTVQNGNYIQVQLESSAIPGFSRTGQIQIGNYTTSFTVQTPAAVQDPIVSQWYSSIQPVKYVLAGANAGDQIRFNTKFDGLPVGSIVPVFQDATQDDNWGDIDGEFNSRFPGMIYCDGSYVDPDNYPMLFAVLQYRYGAEAVTGETFSMTHYDVNGNTLEEEGDSKNYFRLPDMRNRYVKGTGVIDGTQLSSPSLAPTYQPTKLPGSPGNQSPGAFGGMWYVDTIGDPGVDELEQVETPAEGLPAQESQFFGIAQIQTNGYSSVSGIVEFFTSGKCAAEISLKKEKIYDTPLHFHDLISGVPDPGRFKGKILWGQEAGFSGPVKSGGENIIGEEVQNYGPYEANYTFNQWGYYINDDVPVSEDRLPKSELCPNKTTRWWDGSEDPWSGPSGYEGIDEIGYNTSIPLESPALTLDPQTNSSREICAYIACYEQPWPGTGSSDYNGVLGARKAFGTVDIPDRSTTIGGFNPSSKLSHTHYISLEQPFEDDDGVSMYSFGNYDTFGNQNDHLSNNSQDYANETVSLEFNAISDIGIEVLPGTFTLSQTKQLVPEPALVPQDTVAVMSPYTWTKWVIKAY